MVKSKDFKIKKSDEKNRILIYNTSGGRNIWVYLWEYGKEFSKVMNYNPAHPSIPYSVKTSSLFYMGRNYGEN